MCTWLYGNEQVILHGQHRQQPLLPSVARNAEHVRAELEVFDEFEREALPYHNYVHASDWH